jgi:hypothetical protein
MEGTISSGSYVWVLYSPHVLLSRCFILMSRSTPETTSRLGIQDEAPLYFSTKLSFMEDTWNSRWVSAYITMTDTNAFSRKLLIHINGTKIILKNFK